MSGRLQRRTGLSWEAGGNSLVEHRHRVAAVGGLVRRQHLVLVGIDCGGEGRRVSSGCSDGGTRLRARRTERVHDDLADARHRLIPLHFVAARQILVA